ncbi:MAG: sigma 54-interacting transcriptional regulator [Candidatus Hydrogenedentes bacterium]|nr:sigma 54-interacting transcriptional regulator [Candidatus Hydrogenedentota bacterium]
MNELRHRKDPIDMGVERLTAAASQAASLDDYTSADACMQRCLHLARLAARTDLPVLVLGESGTGKTVISQAIHHSSGRARGPYVSFNAAALSDTLLDSQLFGHEKGAFTGADRQVKGKFELAHHGTLFLDEIADLSAAGQAKILRAVEEGEFERLGGEGLLHADVRLITATCHPLKEFVASRRFRQDLFYRIKGITLCVPPLRERRRDLPRMIRREIVRAARVMNKSVSGIEEDAFESLMEHPWPGNLRELNQVIHIAVALMESDVITLDTILLDHFDEPGPPESLELARESGRVAVVPPPLPAEESLSAAEKRHIEWVLRSHGGNKRQTAKALGVSRSTLDRKLTDYSLE